MKKQIPRKRTAITRSDRFIKDFVNFKSQWLQPALNQNPDIPQLESFFETGTATRKREKRKRSFERRKIFHRQAEIEDKAGGYALFLSFLFEDLIAQSPC